MLFNRNDKITNEKTIYQTKPNMLLGCKKAIFGVILLVVVLSVASPIITFIGEMQVYLISYVKLSLTRYTAIALFVIILFIILYIIWQLINWYYMEYILTDSRIIIKSGVLYTKEKSKPITEAPSGIIGLETSLALGITNLVKPGYLTMIQLLEKMTVNPAKLYHLPYGTIQDVSTSQSIVAKILNVGTVSVYSAYDNNQMKLANISNVKEVENIIFSRISNQNNLRSRHYRDDFSINRHQPEYYSDDEYYEPSNDYRSKRRQYEDGGYYGEEEYYEPQDYYRKEPVRDYEYYPEELNFEEEKRHNYEYEPYMKDSLEDNIEGAVNNRGNGLHDNDYYNESTDDYSYSDDDYYGENEAELYYNDPDIQDSKFEENDIGAQTKDSKETIIRRHFDKFKK